jgi:hypothetical protein
MHAQSMHEIARELTAILFTLAGGFKGQGKLLANKQAAQTFYVKKCNRK